MFTKEELSAAIDRYISSLEFPAHPEKLYAPIEYSLEGGGKRLRPVMLLMACNLFSDDIDSALTSAGAIEMFHNFTLLHDDIMDNADLRRGKFAVHKRWDQNVAILSGDAMVICSYQLLQKAPAGYLPEVMREFNKLALEVCEGQQLDIDFESRDNVELGEYMEMIRLKTAVLMAGACRIGAILGGASEADASIMYDFGLDIGLAYQLQDDYLDTYGDEDTLGKPIGGDIEECKKTFLTINALNEAGDATRRAMLATFRDTSHPLSHKISRIRTIYNSLDIPEITRGAISGHLKKAEAALVRLSVGAERTAPLKDLVKTLENRNK